VAGLRARDKVVNGADGLAASSIAVVLGTRPEIIKLSEFLRLLGPAARVVYTGQHYDDRLGPAFFREFGLPPPHTRLAVGGAPRGEQIGEAVCLLDRHFAANPPGAVVVQGDTNSTVAGALAANARHVPLVHIEAGLRSHDRAMPEEHNRIVTDHLADLCCAPTETNRSNLAAEGINGRRVAVTGNTVVEALQRLLPGPAECQELLVRTGVSAAGYVVATFHRPENVDDPVRLEMVLRELAKLPMPVVLPLHPRTATRIAAFGYRGLLDKLCVVPPLAYHEFLALAANCGFLVSDSGGVQEEASVLKRPVLVVRNSTERPEVLGTFAELVQPGPEMAMIANEWMSDLSEMHEKLSRTASPYGDGDASARCLERLVELVGT
jgi:UDP-N-acetylglucosamine 2-epimerase (non-hydrolysing)